MYKVEYKSLKENKNIIRYKSYINNIKTKEYQSFRSLILNKLNSI